ncbi:MAG: glycoside hydrolase domain-containing protein [Promethearchaeota archaeon]
MSENTVILEGKKRKGPRRKVFLSILVSFYLSVLGFFASVLTMSKEILSGREELTTHWILVFILVGINAGYFVMMFVPRAYKDHITLFSGIGSSIAATFLARSFFIYTRENLEPWIIRLSWFFRDEGLILGIFFGVLVFSAITTLSSLLSWWSVRGKDSSQKNSIIYENAYIILIITILFGFFQYLFRYLSIELLFTLVPLLFTAGTAACVPSVVARYSERGFTWDHERGRTVYYRRTEGLEPRRVDEKNKFFRLIHGTLENAGNERLVFWWSFVLLGLSDAAVIYFLATTYPTGTYEYISYLIIPTIVFIVLTSFSMGKRRADQLYIERSIKRWLTNGIPVLEILRIVGLVLILTGSIYFFPYNIYIPEMLYKTSIFAAIGCILQLLSCKRKILSKVIYNLAIIAVILNFILLYNDAMTNAYNYYGPDDLYYPFQYILSLPHAIITGLSIGVIITRELYRVLVKGIHDGSDSIVRAISVVLGVFVFSFLIAYFGWGMLGSPFPGGKIEVWGGLDLSLEENYDFWLIILAACLIGLAIIVADAFKILYLWLINRIRFSRINEQRMAKLRASYAKNADGLKSAGAKHGESKKANKVLLKQYQAILLGIACFIALGAVNVYTSFDSFRQYQSRPVVYYQAGGFALWVANSSERVSPDAKVYLDPANLVKNFTIHAAANEYEAFQLVCTPFGKSLRKPNFWFTNFIDSSTNNIIPSSAFSARQEVNILDDAFPDVLMPVKDDITDSRNHAFWISIRVPYGTSPGWYHGSLNFSYNYYLDLHYKRNSVAINFTVHVWNFTMPRMRHLRTQMGSPYSNRNDTVENFFAHRINDYGISIPSYLNTTTNNWTYDWSSWDANIQWKLDNHANSFIISGGPGWTYDGRTPFVDNDTLMLRLTNWLKGVEAHLKAKNWTRYGYIYYIDEFQMFIPESYNGNRTAYFKDLEEQLAQMKAAAPELRIMTTTPPSAELATIRDYIDIYCPIAMDYDKKVWNEQMAAGKEFWMYYCVGPRAPWANSHLYNRLFETRIMLWQAYLYGLQGFLYWSTSAQYHGSYGFAYNGYGDGWFIHYDDDLNPYDSIRWENYLDAQEDYEYLWMLNRSINYLRENSSVIDSQMLDVLSARLNELLDSVVGERERHCDRASTLIMARLELGTMLEEVARYFDFTTVMEEKWLPTP